MLDTWAVPTDGATLPEGKTVNVATWDKYKVQEELQKAVDAAEPNAYNVFVSNFVAPVRTETPDSAATTLAVSVSPMSFDYEVRDAINDDVINDVSSTVTVNNAGASYTITEPETPVTPDPGPGGDEGDKDEVTAEQLNTLADKIAELTIEVDESTENLGVDGDGKITDAKAKELIEAAIAKNNTDNPSSKIEIPDGCELSVSKVVVNTKLETGKTNGEVKATFTVAKSGGTPTSDSKEVTITIKITTTNPDA